MRAVAGSVYHRAMPVLARLLAFLGLVPFIASAGLLFTGVRTVPWLGPVDHVLSTYALLIVAFMAGTHWGLAIARHDEARVPLYLPSNIVALSAWLAHLTAPLAVQLVVDGAALLLLIVIEHSVRHRLAINDDYLKLRTQVSTVAVTVVIAASLAT